MIRQLVPYREARLDLLLELSDCWKTIRVARHHMRRPVVRDKHPKAYRYQLKRLTRAIVHADRAEDRLAALRKPYSVEWLEACS